MSHSDRGTKRALRQEKLIPLALIAIMLTLGATLAPAQVTQAGFADVAATDTVNQEIMLAKLSEEAWIPPLANSQGGNILDSLNLTQETLDRLKELVSLNFKSEELVNAVRLIAEVTGLNVVMREDDVQGTITTVLANVPAGSALESILKTYELTMIRESAGVFRIVPVSKIRKQTIEMNIRAFDIHWVRAARVADTLQPFLDMEGGIIQADEENNMVIVNAPPHKMVEMEMLISRIDVAERQVLIEARLCELTINATRQLGINWDLARGDSDSLPISQIVGGMAGAATVAGMGNTLTPARTLDLIFASNDAGAGLPGGALNTPTIDQLTIPYSADSFGVYTQQSDNPAGIWEWSKKVSLFGQDFNLSTALDALEKRAMAKTLANPKIVTLNNVTATMSVIRRIPYTTTKLGSGGSQSVTFQYEDVGVTLEVTPQIINTPQGNFVRMNIKPKQMIYISRPVVPGATGVLPRPQIDLRESETNIIVADKDVAVILGLRSQEFNESIDAVPWMHRVPVFGWLFKGKAHNNTKNDLVAFVQPHIITQPGLTDELQARYNEIDDRWSLPDYFFDDVKYDDDR